MYEVRLTEESIRTLDELERRWTPERFAAELMTELSRLATEAAGAVQRGMAGQFIATRTGNLRRSIVGRAEQTRFGPAIRVGVFSGPALPYAGVQEFGTRGYNAASPYPTIKPKTAKALAIPTDRAKTAAGVARTAGFGPRQFTGGELVFIPFRKGKLVGGLFLKEEIKNGVRGGAMFLLATEVDLPERAYLKLGFEGYLPTLVDRLGSSIARWVAGAARDTH